jgi:CRISPR-associated protein Cas2
MVLEIRAKAMMVLVTYDVNTVGGDGVGRLRRVARACQDFGQRVQYSVFEVEVDPAQWTLLKARLEGIIERECDSLRYYFLGANWRRRVEHVGAKRTTDLGGPLIV